MYSPNLTGIRVQGPISQQDMLVAMNVHCGMCGEPFECGDCWAAMPQGPMDAQEAAKAEQGLPFRVMCDPVHFDCVLDRMLTLLNWRGNWGLA